MIALAVPCVLQSDHVRKSAHCICSYSWSIALLGAFPPNRSETVTIVLEHEAAALFPLRVDLAYCDCVLVCGFRPWAALLSTPDGMEIVR